MKYEYEWNKSDLKKELKKRRTKTNIVFLILGILMYLYFIYYPLTSKMFDKKYLLAYGLGYLSCLLLLILIFTKIYVHISLKKNDKNTNKAYGTYIVEVNDNSISVSINNISVKYDYKDIVVFKKKKDRFFIRTNDDKVGLVFKKNVIGEENYNKTLEYVIKNIKKCA